MKDKVSGAIAIPKASWGCAPALPNRIRVVFLRALFPVTSRRQRKSFLVQQFFKNAAEVWASSPHLRSKLYLQLVFPAAIAARWQAKAGVEPPFAGCERLFFLREVLLGKPHESGSARLGHIPSLPGESQLPLKPYPIFTTSRF